MKRDCFRTKTRLDLSAHAKDDSDAQQRSYALRYQNQTEGDLAASLEEHGTCSNPSTLGQKRREGCDLQTQRAEGSLNSELNELHGHGCDHEFHAPGDAHHEKDGNHGGVAARVSRYQGQFQDERVIVHVTIQERCPAVAFRVPGPVRSPDSSDDLRLDSRGGGSRFRSVLAAAAHRGWFDSATKWAVDVENDRVAPALSSLALL